MFFFLLIFAFLLLLLAPASAPTTAPTPAPASARTSAPAPTSAPTLAPTLALARTLRGRDFSLHAARFCWFLSVPDNVFTNRFTRTRGHHERIPWAITNKFDSWNKGLPLPPIYENLRYFIANANVNSA